MCLALEAVRANHAHHVDPNAHSCSKTPSERQMRLAKYESWFDDTLQFWLHSMRDTAEVVVANAIQMDPEVSERADDERILAMS